MRRSLLIGGPPAVRPRERGVPVYKLVAKLLISAGTTYPTPMAAHVIERTHQPTHSIG